MPNDTTDQYPIDLSPIGFAPIDLAVAQTAPFDASPQHRTLAALSGRWRGTCTTTFDPSQPSEECQWDLQATLILGGRAVRIEYTGHAMGQPHAGELLVAFEASAGEWRMPWIDSFHTMGSVMLHRGGLRDDGIIDGLTSYSAGDETWGWRTRILPPEGATLRLHAFNILPDGTEVQALDVVLTQV